MGADEVGRVGHPQNGVAVHAVVHRRHHHGGHHVVCDFWNVESGGVTGKRHVAQRRNGGAKAHAAAFDHTNHRHLAAAQRFVAVEDRVVFVAACVGFGGGRGGACIADAAGAKVGAYAGEDHRVSGFVGVEHGLRQGRGHAVGRAVVFGAVELDAKKTTVLLDQQVGVAHGWLQAGVLKKWRINAALKAVGWSMLGRWPASAMISNLALGMT